MEIGRAAAVLRSAGAQLCLIVASLVAAALIIFVAIDILPGDPAAVVLGLNATPESIAALREEFGFNAPPALRFLGWITGMANGDFGRSTAYRVPVATLISERASVTLPLAIIAMLLALALGLGVALLAAARPRLGIVVTLIGEIGLALPNFWLGLLLIIVFSVTLGLLPSGGFPGWQSPNAARALILPAIALALPQAAIIARLGHTLLNETLREAYIRTAEAKGLTRGAVLFRHALPNAMVPLLALIGLQLSFLLGGSIIVENVFSLPGLGRLMAQAIAQHDIVTLRSLIFLFAATILIVHGLVAALQTRIDPRLARASGLQG